MLGLPRSRAPTDLQGASKNSVFAPIRVSLIGDAMIRERRMGQLGFFDADKRLTALSAKGDPASTLARIQAALEHAGIQFIDHDDVGGYGLRFSKTKKRK